MRKKPKRKNKLKQKSDSFSNFLIHEKILAKGLLGRSTLYSVVPVSTLYTFFWYYSFPYDTLSLFISLLIYYYLCFSDYYKYAEKGFRLKYIKFRNKLLEKIWERSGFHKLFPEL